MTPTAKDVNLPNGTHITDVLTVVVREKMYGLCFVLQLIASNFEVDSNAACYQGRKEFIRDPFLDPKSCDRGRYCFKIKSVIRYETKKCL